MTSTQAWTTACLATSNVACTDAISSITIQIISGVSRITLHQEHSLREHTPCTCKHWSTVVWKCRFAMSIGPKVCPKRHSGGSVLTRGLLKYRSERGGRDMVEWYKRRASAL